MVIKKRIVFIIAVCFCALLFSPAAFAEQSRAISSEAFLSSDFVKYFKNKDYSRALTAIDSLAEKYQDDPLVLRYKGFTLEKLGRRKGAIDIYKKILSNNPDYAPARIFLSREINT